MWGGIGLGGWTEYDVAVQVHASRFSLVCHKNCHEWHAELLGRKYLSDIYYFAVVFSMLVLLWINFLLILCSIVFFIWLEKTVQSRFASFVTMDKIKSPSDTLLDSEIVQSNIFQNISAYI